MTTIHVLESLDEFILRELDHDGPSVHVRRNRQMTPGDAKRVAIPELDHLFGRLNWRFA